jgi:hypothetical protein
MAMDFQELGHVLAGLGWPAGEPIEHLKSGFLATVMFLLYALLQAGRIPVDDR